MTDSPAPLRPSVSDAGPPASANAEGMRGAQRWLTVVDGVKLRQLRREHGLSQWKLADRSGISLTTLGRLERQQQAPCRTYTLNMLAVALGEPPASIRFAPPAP